MTICYNSPHCYANLAYNNWPSDTVASPTHNVKAALMTAAYTPNTNTDSVWADISASESAATGYTAQVVKLSNTIGVITQDVLAGTNPSWTIGAAGATTLVARYIVYYIDATVNGYARPLIAHHDLGQTYTVAPGAGNTQTFAVTESGAVVGAVTAIPQLKRAAKPKDKKGGDK